MKSSKSRLVLGFYSSAEHAEEALHEARKRQIRRSAAIHRAEDGQLTFFHAGLGPLQRAVLGTVLGLISALVAEILEMPRWAFALSAFCGFLVTWFGTVWLGFGIKKTILRHYGRLLFPGESLVAVQETEERTADVAALWDLISHVSVFVIRPGIRLTSSTETGRRLHEPATLASLPARAIELAASHRFEPSTKSRRLLPFVRECEVAIESARADLAEAARLDHGITHATEWLLDNAYLIRSHRADIRHNLPDNHNRILPCLWTRAGRSGCACIVSPPS